LELVLENESEINFSRIHNCVNPSGTAALAYAPFVWGQPASAVQKSISRTKSEGQRILARMFGAQPATSKSSPQRAQRNIEKNHRGMLWWFGPPFFLCGASSVKLCVLCRYLFGQSEESPQKNNAVRASHPNRMLPHEFHAYPLTCKGLPSPCPGPASSSTPHDGGLFDSNPELQSACAPEDAPRLIASTGRSLARRDRSLRRPQRPGYPRRFHVWEPLGSISFRLSVRSGFAACPTSTLWKTAADPAFAITGSVSFTPAVIELSRICSRSAIRIRSGAVRKLWSVEIPCGRRRKTWQKFPNSSQ
jgi:hypothetical protein